MRDLFYEPSYSKNLRSGGRTCMMCGGVHTPEMHEKMMHMNTANMKPMQMANGGRYSNNVSNRQYNPSKQYMTLTSGPNSNDVEIYEPSSENPYPHWSMITGKTGYAYGGNTGRVKYQDTGRTPVLTETGSLVPKWKQLGFATEQDMIEDMMFKKRESQGLPYNMNSRPIQRDFLNRAEDSLMSAENQMYPMSTDTSMQKQSQQIKPNWASGYNYHDASLPQQPVIGNRVTPPRQAGPRSTQSIYMDYKPGDQRKYIKRSIEERYLPQGTKRRNFNPEDVNWNQMKPLRDHEFDYGKDFRTESGPSGTRVRPNVGYGYGGRMMAQDGMRIPSDEEISRDMIMFAESELGVPKNIARKGTMTDLPKGYIPPNSQDYLGYKVSGQKTIEDVLPTDETPVEMTNRTSNIVDSRSAPGVNQETLKKIAGTSKWTGTSNYLPAKVSEMLPGTLKIFDQYAVSSDPDNVFTDDFVQKLKSKGLSEEEIRSVKLNEIHKGKVGDIIGEMMRDAYGVRSKGAGVQSPNANVTNRANTQSYGGNKMNIGQSANLGEFVSSAIDATISNGGILPQGYKDMPEEFKQEVERLASMSKMEKDPVTGEMRQTSTGRDLIGQARIDQRTREAYRRMNENAGSEFERQDSATFEKTVDEGTKVDRYTDLSITPINGKKLSFNEAFAYARENELPVFTWRGELKLAKRPDELTPQEKEGLARAAYKGKSLSGSQSTAPKVTGVNTDMSRTKNVSNTNRTLVPISKKFGGRTNRWQ